MIMGRGLVGISPTASCAKLAGIVEKVGLIIPLTVWEWSALADDFRTLQYQI